MRLTLKVDMRPQAKQRPQVTRHGTYTPIETRVAEQRIRIEWRKEYGYGLKWGRHDPVRLVVWVYLERPATVDRPLPSVAPDWDNYGKLVSDALNGVAWPDDGQVTDGRAIKRYALPGQGPHLLIVVEDDLEGAVQVGMEGLD